MTVKLWAIEGNSSSLPLPTPSWSNVTCWLLLNSTSSIGALPVTTLVSGIGRNTSASKVVPLCPTVSYTWSQRRETNKSISRMCSISISPFVCAYHCARPEHPPQNAKLSCITMVPMRPDYMLFVANLLTPVLLPSLISWGGEVNQGEQTNTQVTWRMDFLLFLTDVISETNGIR